MDDDLEVSIELREKIREQAKLFKPEKWEEIEEFLKDNFPNIPVYRVKHIITGTNGLQAWGMFKNGAIYVVGGTTGQKHYQAVNDGSFEVYNDENTLLNFNLINATQLNQSFTHLWGRDSDKFPLLSMTEGQMANMPKRALNGADTQYSSLFE